MPNDAYEFAMGLSVERQRRRLAYADAVEKANVRTAELIMLGVILADYDHERQRQTAAAWRPETCEIAIAAREIAAGENRGPMLCQLLRPAGVRTKTEPTPAAAVRVAILEAASCT